MVSLLLWVIVPEVPWLQIGLLALADDHAHGSALGDLDVGDDGVGDVLDIGVGEAGDRGPGQGTDDRAHRVVDADAGGAQAVAGGTARGPAEQRAAEAVAGRRLGRGLGAAPGLQHVGLEHEAGGGRVLDHLVAARLDRLADLGPMSRPGWSEVLRTST